MRACLCNREEENALRDYTLFVVRRQLEHQLQEEGRRWFLEKCRSQAEVDHPRTLPTKFKLLADIMLGSASRHITATGARAARSSPSTPSASIAAWHVTRKTRLRR